MMRVALTSTLSVLLTACAHTGTHPLSGSTATLPGLGSHFRPRESAVAVASRGGTRNTYGILVAGVHYAIVVDADDNRVISISTSDPRFITPEGVRVGDPVSRLSALPGRWTSAPFSCSYALGSGWEALSSVSDVLEPTQPCPGAGQRVQQFNRASPGGV